MSTPQQRRSLHSGSNFGAGGDVPPIIPEAGPSRRPLTDRDARDVLNDAGMSGPPSRSRRRVAFARHISKIRSASPAPPESSSFNHGPARGGSRVGPGMGHRESVSVPNHHRHGGPVAVKFRLDRATNSGISVRQALDRERLSQSNNYLLQDIAPNMSGTITLRVNQNGLRTNTYTIPLSSNDHGHVDQQSLAHRTARAVVHYMQYNGINVLWDRVVIDRLEEIKPGIWIPVFMTY